MSSAPPVRPQQGRLQVTDARSLAPRFYSVGFRLIEPTSLDFMPGQYLIFIVPPPKLRHTLSIVTTPERLPRVEVLQGLVPDGRGSKWILGLQLGQTVEFIGPLGSLALHKEHVGRHVFIATGCGIAPFRSIITSYLASGGTSPVSLLWGLRHEDDIFWIKELDELSAFYKNFSYEIALSRPTNGWIGKKGRVTEHLKTLRPNSNADQFYLCGNRAMIDDVRTLLTTQGIPKTAIFTEVFFT